MATVNKNFKVKNGLNVAGTATFESNVVLGSTPLRFDTVTNKLQIQLNGQWMPIALNSEVPDENTMINLMDVGLAIDYNGEPIYTIQANGVSTTATKFADGGSPSTPTYGMVFDSGNVDWESTPDISFLDIGLAIDYNGLPVYTVQGNGVSTSANKYANGGSPSTLVYELTFDSGALV